MAIVVGINMDRVPSGIPDKFFDLSNHFKTIDINRPPKDKDVNDLIQKQGFEGNPPRGGTLDEFKVNYYWYQNNKGYSSKIKQ